MEDWKHEVEVDRDLYQSFKLLQANAVVKDGNKLHIPHDRIFPSENF